MRVAPTLRNNVGLKILSLALALLLWFFVHGTKIDERDYNIPIRYVNLPDSLMFVEPPASQMRVRLSGPVQDLLLRLNLLRNVEARIDLSGATARLDRAVPSISDITEPANERVAVTRIMSPSVIALRLGERDVRTLPLRVVLATMPEGFCLLDSAIAIPRQVICTGPRMYLRHLEEIATLPFALPKKVGRHIVETGLALTHPSLQCDVERVRVALRLERLQQVLLEQQPITIVPPASADLWVAADVGAAQLTVAGPEPLMATLVPEDFGLFLDTSRLEPGRYDALEVVWRFPDWAQLVRVEPPVVGVTVHYDPEGTGRASPDSADVQVP